VIALALALALEPVLASSADGRIPAAA